MNPSSISIEGRYYDGKSPLALPALLRIDGTQAALSGGGLNLSFATSALIVSPRVGRAERFISFPDGGQYQCADHPFLDRMRQDIQSEGPVAWLEERLAVAVASVIIIACLLISGYFFGLPALAEKLVSRIPIKTEILLGDQTLAWLDDQEWFEPSQVDHVLQESITRKFTLLHRYLPTSSEIRLEFRYSELFGANAFALPGGTIIITDQMMGIAQSEEEILAVLAHEMGHVENRHSMRQILQTSLAGLLVATLTADASSVSTAITGLPAMLVQSKYSRDFETEADDFAFELLKHNNIPAESFATLMERLSKEKGGREGFSFLSSHPATAKRVERARAADSN